MARHKSFSFRCAFETLDIVSSFPLKQNLPCVCLSRRLAVTVCVMVVNNGDGLLYTISRSI
jgi:hypothetical protein